MHYPSLKSDVFFSQIKPLKAHGMYAKFRCISRSNLFIISAFIILFYKQKTQKKNIFLA